MTDFRASVDEPGVASRPRVPRRQRWLHLVLYLTIFVSGTVVGAGGALIVVRNQVLHAAHHPEEMPTLIARRMRRVLSLDDDQARRVEAILRERQTELQSLRREYQPRVEQQLDLLEVQISEVLNEQQRASWQHRIRELRETWIPDLPPEKEGQ